MLANRHGYLRQPWALILFLCIHFIFFVSHGSHGTETERTILLLEGAGSFLQNWVSRIEFVLLLFPLTLASKNTSQNKVLTYSDIFSDSCICNEEKYNKSVKVYGNFHLLLVNSVLIKYKAQTHIASNDVLWPKQWKMVILLCCILAHSVMSLKL